MLLGGTDPLLQLPEERDRFKAVAARLYAPEEVAKYIAWEATKFIQRVEIDGGKRLKVVKDFKVNRQLFHHLGRDKCRAAHGRTDSRAPDDHGDPGR